MDTKTIKETIGYRGGVIGISLANGMNINIEKSHSRKAIEKSTKDFVNSLADI